jgi:hypothetical protein
MPVRNITKGAKVYFTHDFRTFCPWSLTPFLYIEVERRGVELLTSEQPGSRKRGRKGPRTRCPSKDFLVGHWWSYHHCDPIPSQQSPLTGDQFFSTGTMVGTLHIYTASQDHACALLLWEQNSASPIRTLWKFFRNKCNYSASCQNFNLGVENCTWGTTWVLSSSQDVRSVPTTHLCFGNQPQVHFGFGCYFADTWKTIFQIRTSSPLFLPCFPFKEIFLSTDFKER